MSGQPAVGAVVLSMGEPYAQRARASLATQTVPLAPIAIVEQVAPFSRALNQGASMMSAPFFIQVDADMILDPHCAETLLARVRGDTGLVVAELRDALSGRAVGVKLFRTECFCHTRLPDSIGQDTDFVEALERRGWRTVYVEDAAADGRVVRPALGEHRPDYTPAYTYRKLLVEGAKLRHRAAPHGLFWRMGTIEEAGHPLSSLAQLALGHGFFLRSSRDELRPVGAAPEAERLVTLLQSDTVLPDLTVGLLPVGMHPRLGDVFRGFLEAGETIGRHHAGGALRALFAGLTGARQDSRALVAKVALGHGLLRDEDGRRRSAADERAFMRFMVFRLGSRSTFVDHVRERVRVLTGARERPASYVPW